MPARGESVRGTGSDCTRTVRRQAVGWPFHNWYTWVGLLHRPIELFLSAPPGASATLPTPPPPAARLCIGDSFPSSFFGNAVVCVCVCVCV